MRRVIFVSLLASTCFGQSSLSQFLGLTSAQQTSIKQLNQNYSDYLDGESQQFDSADQAISQLYSQSSPDPAALGRLYVQEEMIRRDMASHLSALQTQAAAQLTTAQAALVQQLADSITLQPLAADAACAFLMQQFPSSNGVFTATSFPGNIIPASRINTSAPYVPPAPSGTFCGSQVFPISIREYLNVTDAQVTALAAASAAYNDYYAKQQDQINDLYVNIRDESARVSPDPVALGTFYSQLASIGKSIQQEQADLQQQAQQLLTDVQRTALKKIQDSAALRPTALQAGACNLLIAPPGTSVTGFYSPCRL